MTENSNSINDITRALITWQWLAKKNCKENISRDVDNEIEGWKIEKI